MRGRTMALFVIAVGGTSPVGAPLLGWLCEAVGVRTTLAIGALVTALMSLAMWAYLRRASTEAQPAAEDGAAAAPSSNTQPV
jgi:predicted MFS family arabinose efflux permease